MPGMFSSIAEARVGISQAPRSCERRQAKAASRTRNPIAFSSGVSVGALVRGSACGSALTIRFIEPWRYSMTSRDRCRATGAKPMDCSTDPSACGCEVAYSMNSMPSIPSGLLGSGLDSRVVIKSLCSVSGYRSSGAVRDGSALLLLQRDFDDRPKGGRIGAPTQSLDRTDHDRRDHRAMAPFLSDRQVRQVNLDDRKRHCRDRVVKRNPVVGDSGGIDDGAVGLVDVRVQGVDQDALMVRLRDHQLGAELARQGFEPGIHIRERLLPVDMRLAPPQEVQVRSVQNQYAHWSSPVVCIIATIGPESGYRRCRRVKPFSGNEPPCARHRA